MSSSPDGRRPASSRPREHERRHQRAVGLIREGARLHYERDDDDALLRGDQLYAQGLLLLAANGDLCAISQLADAISHVARVQAEAAPSDSRSDVDDTLHDALN